VYKDAVIYQLHVRSVCDSNADGVGDFVGLIQSSIICSRLEVTFLAYAFLPITIAGRRLCHATNVRSSKLWFPRNFKMFLRLALIGKYASLSKWGVNHTSTSILCSRSAKLPREF